MKMGITLIIVGLLISLGGVVLIMRDKTSGNQQQINQAIENDNISDIAGMHKSEEYAKSDTVEKTVIIEKHIIHEVVQSEEPDKEKTGKEKGNDFEAFMADIMKSNGLHMKEWNQGTVSPGGVLADNALNPDFFVQQPTDKNPIEYWVECKYRSRLNGEFSLEQYQIERYRKIQSESKRKIIVALGVGGSSDRPKSLYVVPLDSIEDGKLSQDKLRQFYMSNPETQFSKRMAAWFFKEVFKKKNK